MGALFDIDTTVFTIFAYKMSYLELTGTLLNIASVWLVARNKISTWPVGIAAVCLFAILFYQVELYSDVVEQFYFLVTGFYGWWVWARLRARLEGQSPEPGTEGRSANRYMHTRGRLISLAIVAGGTALMGGVMSNIHEYLPTLFPEPAAFPYLDAFTTVMSFTAQILMAHKRIESWLYWIVVDVIGIGLYFVRDVKLISLLYVIFLVLAARGFFLWRREYHLNIKQVKEAMVAQPDPVV